MYIQRERERERAIYIYREREIYPPPPDLVNSRQTTGAGTQKPLKSTLKNMCCRLFRRE